MNEIVLLSNIERIGLAIMVVLLMLGMGATLTIEDFKKHLKAPKALLIGFTSQFGFMPLIAYGLCLSLDFPAEIALTVVLVGCTPGGTTSNLFTYYSKGDVALSISMTAASTILAIVIMPILVILYASQLATTEVQIPVKNIIATLIAVIVPVLIGVYIRSKSEKVAVIVEKSGSIIGIVVIIFLVVEYLLKNNQLFVETGYKIYLASILLGLFGFLIGYIISKLLKLSEREARSISMETGIQNTPLTIAIISLSFPPSSLNQLLVFPVFYAVFIVVSSAAVSLLYRRIGIKD